MTSSMVTALVVNPTKSEANMSKFEKYLESSYHMATHDSKAKDFDIFFHSYLETALWSSTDGEDKHLDQNYDFKDIDRESYTHLKDEAQKFFNETYDMISSDLKKAGHDFWLTRNGHGAGFWDGDWDDEVGKKLTQVSKKYKEIDLYVGDDDKIYV